MRIFKISDFSRSIITLFTGSTISNIIPVVISPILTRIYSPNDFGVLALFSAVITILGVISTGKLDMAVLLPKLNKHAIFLSKVSILLSIIVGILIFITLYIFKDFIILITNNKDIQKYFYLIPFTIIGVGLFNNLSYLSIRNNQYKKLAKANILRACVISIVQVSIGLIRVGPLGLVLGKTLGEVSSNMLFIKRIIHMINYRMNYKQLVTIIKRYKNFPIFVLPSSFVNSLSQNINNFFISGLYGASELGFYGLFTRVIGLPITLISTSFSNVFFKYATDERKVKGDAQNIFNASLKKLFIMAILIFCPLYFFIEDIFSIIYGHEWIMAGKYAKIMFPLIAIRFVVAPLSMINITFEKQKAGFFWQTVLLLLSLIVFGISFTFNLNIEMFLKLYTYILSVHYLFLLFLVYRFSSGKDYVFKRNKSF